MTSLHYSIECQNSPFDLKITQVILTLSLSTSAGIYLFKVNNRNTRKRCEISSKLTMKTLEQPQWRRSGAFIVYFEHISHLVLVFLLLTLDMSSIAGWARKDIHRYVNKIAGTLLTLFINLWLDV